MLKGTEDRIYKLKSIYKTFNLKIIQEDTLKISQAISFNHYINLGGILKIDVDYLNAKNLYNN